jgi:hypothetical protein
MDMIMVRRAVVTPEPTQEVHELTEEEQVNVIVDNLPGVTFSGAVSAVVNEAVEGYRWQNRLSRADVVKEALTQWCESRDLLDGARDRLVKENTPETVDDDA